MSFRFIKAGMLLAAMLTRTSQVDTFAQKSEKCFKSIFDGKNIERLGRRPQVLAR